MRISDWGSDVCSSDLLVEDVELRARVAAKLERDQRKQYRFTGARGADDKHVADIADMGGQPKRRRAGRLGVYEWRTAQLGVLSRSRPHCRERHHVGEVEQLGRASCWLRVCKYV